MRERRSERSRSNSSTNSKVNDSGDRKSESEPEPDHNVSHSLSIQHCTGLTMTCLRFVMKMRACRLCLVRHVRPYSLREFALLNARTLALVNAMWQSLNNLRLIHRFLRFVVHVWSASFSLPQSTTHGLVLYAIAGGVVGNSVVYT